MKTIDIYGENRFEQYTKVREACRGIVIDNGRILLTYEVNTVFNYKRILRRMAFCKSLLYL